MTTTGEFDYVDMNKSFINSVIYKQFVKLNHTLNNCFI